jgi:hypothetical protein
VKFRRKSDKADKAGEGAGTGPADGAGAGASHDAPAASEEEVLLYGPMDIDDIDTGGEEMAWVDLGSLLITPGPGMQLRMQVDEATERVQAVILTGTEGALEVMAFAAPRNATLWDEVRPQIAADMARRGGQTSEREGRWGTELECRLQVQRGDGTPTVQPSRIIGIDGPRWMVRATLLGRPAVDDEAAELWETVLANLVVRRGNDPMPVGDQLPIVLPPEARPAS